MAKTKWPNEVPVLEGTDICQGPYRHGECRCTVAWAVDVFGTGGSLGDFDGRGKVIGLLCESAVELRATYADLARDSAAPHIYSDCRQNSTALIARIWNRAMAKLGYVVGNPEAKNLKTRKR